MEATQQNSLGRKIRLHVLRIIRAAQGTQEPWSVPLLTHPISFSFLNDMFSIILRFRSYTYGVSTDIEKTFLHVGLNES